MVPPYAEKTVKIYNGRVEALASILDFLKEQKEKYVVMADTNLAVNFDFNALIEAHMESGADVTVAYTRQPLPQSALEAPHTSKDMYYTLSIDGGGRVNEIQINSKETGDQNFSMNIYIMDRQFLIDQVSSAFVRGQIFFERDILAPNLDRLNVHAFRYEGYVARICDMKSYFQENMKMLDDANVDALFGGSPIYTKIRDDNPTRYMSGAAVKNIMAADGCLIEGEVENSILFRGVKIGKGAKVKNCVLMQDTVVEPGANLEYVITDKDVAITEGKELKGNDSFPVYVAKYQKV